MPAAPDVDRLLADAEARLHPGPAVPAVAADPAVADAIAAAERVVVLAGPGVVADGHVDGLRAFAAAANLGVLNTWGAKGVFDWRSPHHLATAGLQARDFELGGLAGADLVVATGIDVAEAPPDRWRAGTAVVEVAPAALADLATRIEPKPGDIEVPPLRSRLAAITQDGWASTAAPLPPTLVTKHYGDVLGAGGLVAADPGVAGYWVARTFATTTLGGAQVTADAAAAGFAVACCLVAREREPERPVLAVVDAPVAPAVEAMLDEAARRGVAVPVEGWSAAGDEYGVDDHREQLRSRVDARVHTMATVATDATQLARMIDAAGEIIAWPGRFS